VLAAAVEIVPGAVEFLPGAAGLPAAGLASARAWPEPARGAAASANAAAMTRVRRPPRGRGFPARCLLLIECPSVRGTLRGPRA
jgi:hypothetical protein